MKYQLKFVPLQQNKAVFYLPLDTELKEDAEKIAFELADVLNCHRWKSIESTGTTAYIKDYDEGQEDIGDIPDPEYYFMVV